MNNEFKSDVSSINTNAQITVMKKQLFKKL